MPDTGKHLRTCNLCEAMCGIVISHDQGTIQSIKGDPEDPLSKGYICPKAVALQDIHNDPDRLHYPLLKTTQGWEEISWDNALNEVAARLRSIQAKHGKDAVGVYLGNPNIHNVGTMLTLKPFLQALGTRNNFSATSVDQLAPMLVALKMFGNQLLMPVPDIDRTQFMVCLGANPVASNGSLMTAPGFKHRVKALQERGGRLVVIDPRKTETANIADEHHFITPGSDALLLAAMLHTLFDQGLERPGCLQGQMQGINIVRNMVKGFSPERVAQQVGLSAADIRRLTQDFANAPSACFYGRMGTSTQEFGTLTNWLMMLFNALSGNLDKPGGMMFTRPAIDLPGLAPMMGASGSFGRRKSRVRGFPEFGGEYPASTLADEILTAGKGQIRAMVTLAGNPVLSLPNGSKVNRALKTLDFMVAVDFYLNETTQHADIILPPTGPLEHDHYDLILNLLTVRNTAKYSKALYKPLPNSRHDWEILSQLTRKLRPNSAIKFISGEAQYQMINRLKVTGMLDLLLRLGPYGEPPKKGSKAQRGVAQWIYKQFPESKLGKLLDLSPLSRHTLSNGQRLTLETLLENPHGIDLGPLQPCLPDRISRKNKSINLVPSVFMRDIARLQNHLQQSDKLSPDAFRLIGRRDLRSNNSWMHNSQRLTKGSNKCRALMNTSDGQRLQLENNDMITISSQSGEIQLPVVLTDDIMPGVISVPHGWGHHHQATQLRVAKQNPGVSINDVTDDQFVDEVTGVASFNGQPVTVSTVQKIENVVRINDKRLASTPNG